MRQPPDWTLSPGSHRLPSRFRFLLGCAAPLRLATRSRSLPRAGTPAGWNGRGLPVRHRRPAPRQAFLRLSAPTSFPPRCCVPQKSGAPLGRVPPAKSRSLRRSPIGPEPHCSSRGCPRSTSIRRPRWPRAVRGFPSRCSVSSRRGVSRRRIAAGIDPHCWRVSLVRTADSSALPPRPPQAPSRVDTRGRLSRQPDASATPRHRLTCRR